MSYDPDDPEGKSITDDILERILLELKKIRHILENVHDLDVEEDDL